MARNADPRWPEGAAGVRVLVECDDPAVQDGLARALQEQGYAVAACGGPRARSSGECPLVAQGSCHLVEDADVVVHALDPADAAHREVLGFVTRRARAGAVVAEATPGTGAPEVDPDECQWVRYPMTRGSLLDAVDRATGR